MKNISARAAVFAALLAAVPAAQAAPHGIRWAQGARPSTLGTPKISGNLRYYGGPVISNAKVYVVFWGDMIHTEVRAKIGPFFENMLDSGYMDWLSEYDTNLRAVDGRPGTNQHIGRGRFLGSISIEPANRSKSLTDAMIQAELDAQMAAGKLPAADDNSLYMVYFPHRVTITIAGLESCSNFCAYHEGFKSPRTGGSVFYGVMPSCGGYSCGEGFDAVTITSSHECIEAITDPFPTPGNNPAYPQAWNTADGAEISDLCAEGSSTVTGHGITSHVTWQWDNKTSSCAKGPWNQAPAPRAPRTPAVSSAPMPLFEALRSAPGPIWSGR